MEVLESIPWVILGFIPTLTTLEIYRQITNRRTTTGEEPRGISAIEGGIDSVREA